MWRFRFIALLIVHGAIHAAIWVLPRPEGHDAPFDPSYSWLLGRQRGFASLIAACATVLLVAAGSFLLARVSWWRFLALAGLGVSFAFMILFFDSSFLTIEVVNAGLIVWLLRGDGYQNRWSVPEGSLASVV